MALTRIAPSEICEAIRNVVRLEFSHKGHHRVVEPYCHGISTKGKEVLRAIQVRGTSSKERPGFKGGKLWDVQEMSELRVLDEPFVPDDPDYNPNDSAMVEIHCRIERPSKLSKPRK
jgi:hypothetical protein